MNLIESTYAYNIIYVYSIDNDKHRGILKIGKATLTTTPKPFDKLPPMCDELVQAAKERINQQTTTSGTSYKVEYVELAHFIEDGKDLSFTDSHVHHVLLNSGYERHEFKELDSSPQEWFEVDDVEIVKQAIKAVKEGRNSIDGPANKKSDVVIKFRDEQIAAINKTTKFFEKEGKMLWNAKMRFGKTLCALEVVRQCKFGKTLILTHRPAVKSGWFEDFRLIKFENYIYGSKPSDNNKNGQLAVGESFEYLQKSGKPFIYFASMQDLRGSWEKNSGKQKKNQDVFGTKWDLVIIDEAHEGTNTQLGQHVIHTLEKKCKRFLYLSGTPYNILNQFKPEEIYTWDYIQEQTAKEEWPKNHKDEENPYEGLARLNIRTYNLGRAFENYNHSDEDYFDFSEFFRTLTGNEKQDGRALTGNEAVGDFVHAADVHAFLDLLCKQSETSYYPFSREEYKLFFAHTFWVLPGVSAAKALSTMLREHPFFKQFYVVNVAGDGDEMENNANADDSAARFEAEKNCVEKVKKAIKGHERTITLSCGRMTTGVSIEQWTAVFMLAGAYNTKAAGYLQTIFRAQTPFKHTPGIKKECYAFDFAPDRTLTVIDEYIKNAQFREPNPTGGKTLTTESFLRFCSVIAIDGSSTIDYDAHSFMTQVNRAYAEHIVGKGFRDRRLYNGISTVGETDLDWIKEIAAVLNGKGGKTKGDDGKVTVTDEGMTGENATKPDSATTNTTPGGDKPSTRKPKRKPSPDEVARTMLQDILHIVSVRMPMMIYGTVESNENLTLEGFIDSVDTDSWQEFMPRGFTKEHFKKHLLKYYNNDAFLASVADILSQAKATDNLGVKERVEAVAGLVSKFHYPDRETVLTPWRVVNMHMADALGGYDFFNEQHDSSLLEPRFVEHKGITREVFGSPETRILEINSKSGVYPLWIAYTLFRMQCDGSMFAPQNPEDEHELWKQVVEKNIFVVCKTNMAQKITNRALAGYSDDIKPNTMCIENLVDTLRTTKDYTKIISKITNPKAYDNNNMKGKLKFNAVVGNPPYQEVVAKIETDNGQKVSISIFQHFQMLSDRLARYTALIYPGGRWIHRSGKGMEKFGLDQINDPHLSMIHFFPKSTDVFKDVAIADGISIVLKDMNKKEKGFLYIYSKDGKSTEVQAENPGEDLMPLNPLDAKIVSKIKHVVQSRFAFLHDTILPRSLFSIESDFVENNPLLVREYQEGDTLAANEVKLFTNDKAGKSGRARWYVVDRSVIKTGAEYLNRWKVIVSSANAGGQKRSNQISVVDNRSAFGRSRVALKTFDTEQEALNFYRYCNSKLIRYTFLLTDEALTSLAKLVPDISDYKDDNGVLDFSANIDAQLYGLFSLTTDEVKFIEEMIRPME